MNDPETGIHPDPPAPPAPARRRRERIALLITVTAVIGYVLALRFVPGFGDYTKEGLHGLGLYEGPPDPGRRDLVVTEQGTFLWGGPDPSSHFDIDVFRLDPDQLYHGLGRERFTALIEPTFVTLAAMREAGTDTPPLLSMSGPPPEPAEAPAAPARKEMSTRWPGDGARVLTVQVGEVVKVYPLQTLRRHEVVNDVVGDVPIFVAYCYLAELAAAYDRRLGTHTLTFAVSGYTYADPDVWDGRNAFVLWDRDTESLWWPPIGRAVSGPLIDAPLRLLDRTLWRQTTWGEAKRDHPEALVLAPNQTFKRPRSWPRLDVASVTATTRPDTAPAIAPRWDPR